MAEKPPAGGKSPPPQDIVTGVTEVVNAALGVGASLAKAFAQATAAGVPVSAPSEGAGPLNAIVHYGVAAVTNVAGFLINSAGGIRMGTSADAAPAAASRAVLPRVHQGATLRIPLSIENPGEQPMNNITFGCSEIVYLGKKTGPTLSANNVRFQPPTLEIPPHDFEKLTLFIDTGADTATGRYRVKIETGAGGVITIVEFDVVQAGEQ